ncbi:hypothetical protein [Nitratidesulfovibrio vulgaris]|jgi:hypothetical protein|uniref:Uncharacterized protein n=1 Tax=Nitratidesulfovibrio vulgaris (strain DP4) TaxID=391774 RepID=A0A0H3A808_NITV4|nr:hypothetical protein [Nitratidesulfovibrio vulgaris]GEB80423.1 hypothetical protein DDE01_18380 [Desulfovibrio desulfuricans]HBW17354.1 hypothetical protein [Desulfovibrio sp.]ABM28180.1 conserved hypothetical protein [Nitratidesulfovibrio vulgaris DP4]ADP87069.1 hypothetical protein Deval_1920 [Nitratidesulfovibrio vulgaris RCH1]WCB45592.1 hypothetical protein PH214_11010 [Nitratidesulfovibrio vulgaris]
MQKLTLEQAAPGMRLARPVQRPDGVPLVGEGVELTDIMLERFATAGVAEIYVEGNPVPVDDGSGVDFARIAGRLEHLFRKHGEDRFMATMHQFLMRRFSSKARETAGQGM